MKPGFYTIMAAQFFSSLADNALLIAAIALLRRPAGAGVDDAGAQDVLRRLLRGAGAAGGRVRRLDAQGPGDADHQRHQGRRLRADAVLRCTRSLAYAVVGFGAAAYSPAKYGILTELLPPQQLVVANGWIEGTTVGSIILGVLVGGALISARLSTDAARLRPAPHRHRHRHAARGRDRVIIVVFYVIAAIFNWFIPDTGVDHRMVNRNPLRADPRVRALQRAALARPAGADLAGHDDAVLGRRRDAAVHRASTGRARRSDSRCRRRRCCRAWSRWASRIGAVLAARCVSLRGSVERAADRHRDGRHRHGDDLRRPRCRWPSC